ncbi:hypothetical protein EYF80_058767 [Liparis tanakae]|uniref:Uncharacterized protein n=1 Tax=Liparis tanakae TaxID=230148 RepID=A0A4Z2ER75_9TELE|nr:hypothetical protein EYF80_058767 [Liparis tanakae]
MLATRALKWQRMSFSVSESLSFSASSSCRVRSTYSSSVLFREWLSPSNPPLLKDADQLDSEDVAPPAPLHVLQGRTDHNNPSVSGHEARGVTAELLLPQATGLVLPSPSTRDSVMSMHSERIMGTMCLKRDEGDGVPTICGDIDALAAGRGGFRPLSGVDASVSGGEQRTEPEVEDEEDMEGEEEAELQHRIR